MDKLSDRGDRKTAVVAASEFRVRARFYAIHQVDGERAYDWYKRVRAAAVPCGFGVVNQSQWTPVVDKFVTGLLPGPVADRLLSERADSRLDVLLAAAVEAEVVTGGARRLPAGGASPDLLTEIRERLKLYRYSSDGYERGLVSCDDRVKHLYVWSTIDLSGQVVKLVVIIGKNRVNFVIWGMTFVCQEFLPMMVRVSCFSST